MLLQHRQIPIKHYLTHISQYSEQLLLEFSKREVMLCLQEVHKH